eukprot:gene9712-9871_t
MASRNKEATAISMLAKLAKASDLSSFAMKRADAGLYLGFHDKLASMAARNQEVLQAWLTTLAQGYRLFLAEQQQWASGSPKATATSLETLLYLASGDFWTSVLACALR